MKTGKSERTDSPAKFRTTRPTGRRAVNYAFFLVAFFFGAAAFFLAAAFFFGAAAFFTAFLLAFFLATGNSSLPRVTFVEFCPMLPGKWVRRFHTSIPFRSTNHGEPLLAVIDSLNRDSI